MSVVQEFNKNLKQVDKPCVECQTPKYGVLTCSDSRINISHLTWEDTYDNVFEIENAGNTVNERNLGTISYALDHLWVQQFFVIGHSTCWACSYAHQTKTEAGEPLLDQELAEIKELACWCDSAEQLEKKNIQQQIQTLRHHFPDHQDKIIWLRYNLQERYVEEVK